MDHDELMDQMQERFREEFFKAIDALENAPDGHWIEAGEMALREAASIVGREGFELALQARVDAHPTVQVVASCPSRPGDQRPSAHAR